MTSGVQETTRPVPQLGNVLDLSAGLITAGLLALSYTGESGLPRMLLARAFTFFVPGRAIVTDWTRMASGSRVAMPAVLSLALLTLVATIALWAHAWKPMDLFQVEAWLSLAGLCFGIARRNRHRADDGARPQELRARRNT
jgi:peptidoglycan/LPS O-acetylase OafA/YrhL